MWRVWAALNAGLLGLAMWTGYAEMEPERLSNANPDIVFCAVALITAILLSLGSVWYSIYGAKQTTLRRPSWRRFSMDWWHDPLQCLFLTCCVMGAMAVGAAFRLPGTSQSGFWMFMFFLSIFAGLLIGQFAVYGVYRERIE